MKLPKSQKGFAQIIIIVGVIVILGSVGGLYLLGKSGNKPTDNVVQNEVSQTSTPYSAAQQPSTPSADLLVDVPIYPGAKFIKREFIPDCPGEQHLCNVNSYKWESSSKIEDVIKWYDQDSSKSGWKLKGGAGEGVNRYGWFTNGKVTYWLTIYMVNSEGLVGIEFDGPPPFDPFK